MYLQIVGWMMLIGGILQCISGILQFFFVIINAFGRVRANDASIIIGALIGSLFTLVVGYVMFWVGSQLQKAGSAIAKGVETGDKGKIHSACKGIANYFRVIGIMAIVTLVLSGLLIMFILFLTVLGLAR